MKGKGAKFFIYVLLGMLILGLAGFGIGNFGGSIRSLGKVGETEIDVNTYARALQAQLRVASQQTGRTVTMAEARQIGLDRQVLGQVVTTVALDEEARRLGLSVGDERVAGEIRNLPAFQGLSGSFDREAYAFALEQNGMSAKGFEEDVRRDTARTLLQAAVVAGIDAPATYAETIYGFLGERRAFAWARIGASALPSVDFQPSEEELAAFHDSNPEQFTLPETRVLTYIHLAPEMMLDSVSMPEDELRAAYQERIEEYVQPERRIVYRLVFPDEAAASAGADAIADGTSDFEALAEARGLSLDDIALGEVARADLDPAVAEAVFAMTDTGEVGPLPTALGPAIFRVAAILNAQEITFDEARDELQQELAADATRRAVAAEIEPMDDLLAGGATLEELAAETPAELGTLSMTAAVSEGIAGYAAFREAALAAQVGDFPELITLEDGGVAALRVEEIQPPRVQDLSEVREAAISAWQSQAITAALVKQAETVRSILDRGTGMASLGLSPRTEELTRDAFIDGAPTTLMSTVFTMEPGQIEIVEGVEEVYLVALDAILPPDPEDADAGFVRDLLQNQASEGLAQDIFAAFAGAVQAEAGLQLDQAAINAVHANFP